MMSENYSRSKINSTERVLALLQDAQGSFVSGEEIADRLGISRTAVWKAVHNLKDKGHVIDSVTNRGYRLSSDSDILSETCIRRFLSGEPSVKNYFNEESVCGNQFLPCIEFQDIAIDVFDTVDSTNTICLKRASYGGVVPYAAVSGEQTSGRGRRGRSFFSPEGTGLYMSILIRPYNVSAETAMAYTTIAAVAVAEAIEEISGVDASIKWVNDIYVRGRKVCGILTEASFNPETALLDYAVVGIGINVYEPAGGFPEEIRDRAGSIAGHVSTADTIKANGGRNRLAAEIIRRFFRYIDSSDTNDSNLTSASGQPVPGYVQEYRKRCFVIGTDVDVIQAGSEPVRAHVIDLDDRCGLIVRYEDGVTETISSGEISIRL